MFCIGRSSSLYVHRDECDRCCQKLSKSHSCGLIFVSRLHITTAVQLKRDRTPFSTAAARVAMLGQLEACSRSLYRFSRDIRMGMEEVRLLKYEVSNCRVLAKAREKEFDPKLRDQSKLAHKQIRAIRHKLKPRRPYHGRHVAPCLRTVI